jgi:2-dehydro-3-deoxyphosphooctonate aldolase (KDO 8-P synthase)
MSDIGFPVVFDATHSVQLPSGAGGSSGGQPQFISTLASAASAVGIQGLFVEVHDHPERALSDGANALRLDRLEALLRRVRMIHETARKYPA